VKRLSLVRWTEQEKAAAAYARWTPVYPWPRPPVVLTNADPPMPKRNRLRTVGLSLGGVALAVVSLVLVLKVVA
jgi:hypothetical protein